MGPVNCLPGMMSAGKTMRELRLQLKAATETEGQEEDDYGFLSDMRTLVFPRSTGPLGGGVLACSRHVDHRLHAALGREAGTGGVDREPAAGRERPPAVRAVRVGVTRCPSTRVNRQSHGHAS